MPLRDRKLAFSGRLGAGLSVEHAAVADGASDLFVQLFGAAAGHVRVVYGPPCTKPLRS